MDKIMIEQIECYLSYEKWIKPSNIYMNLSIEGKEREQVTEDYI